MKRAYKFKVHPNKNQEDKLRKKSRLTSSFLKKGPSPKTHRNNYSM
jgi:hypothetical protein